MKAVYVRDEGREYFLGLLWSVPALDATVWWTREPGAKATMGGVVVGRSFEKRTFAITDPEPSGPRIRTEWVWILDVRP